LRAEMTRRRDRGRRDPERAARLTAAVLAAPFLAKADAGIVAATWPLGSEADLRPALAALAARGVACALPVVFRAWSPGLDLVPGRYGVAVPPATAPVVVPDIVLVPLLAFDRHGARLGYGGGFYDRTLADLRARPRPVLAAGVGFAFQEVAAVPRDDRDQPLDWLVTENGAVAAARSETGESPSV
jgi:5-formyltetrahydrofolate cyclo-ligase